MLSAVTRALTSIVEVALIPALVILPREKKQEGVAGKTLKPKRLNARLLSDAYAIFAVDVQVYTLVAIIHGSKSHLKRYSKPTTKTSLLDTHCATRALTLFMSGSVGTR